MNEGKIRGKQLRYENGALINSFRGIPYANPLRFKAPEPLLKFSNDPLDCYENGPQCPQLDPKSRKITGSEDCLHLNVFSPANREGKLPVMVWFHGGGFTLGCASDRTYSPEYLVDKNIILVCVNYRIGPFGFLSYPEGGILGNAGLKDQQLALKWVSRNIDQFGGDPGNVTIFGQSSGAVSCHLHLLNEESRRYFHKLICQSACATSGWALSKNPSEKAVQLANLINDGVSNAPADVVKTLIAASVVQLIKYSFKTLTPMEKCNIFAMPFVPAVEPKSPFGFLTEHPKVLVDSFQNHTHPMILGYAAFEGSEAMNHYRRDSKKFSDVSHFVPCSLDLSETDLRFLEVGQEMKHFYYRKEGSDPTEDCRSIVNWNRDKIQLMSVLEVAKRLANSRAKCVKCLWWSQLNLVIKFRLIFSSRAPLFFYEFAYDGSFNLFKQFFQVDEGPVHGDDVYYLFGRQDLEYFGPQDHEESRAVRELMCEMWTFFAKWGTPNSGKKMQKFEWSPVNNSQLNLLHIPNSRDCQMTRNKDAEQRLDFWRYIHSKYTRSKL